VIAMILSLNLNTDVNVVQKLLFVDLLEPIGKSSFSVLMIKNLFSGNVDDAIKRGALTLSTESKIYN